MAGYMLDLRVDKAYRSGITAIKLLRAAEDHIRRSDADLVVANFLKDNKRSLVFTSGRGGLPAAHYLGTNRIFNIIPIRRMALDKSYEIEKLTEKDIPEIVRSVPEIRFGLQPRPRDDRRSFQEIPDFHRWPLHR
ncbi:MAG: hypothetical protein MZV63_35055 [Marinilabiliales bacterium]|nr:hypothetical protein [Marinilabiliales bacterium]